MTSLRDKRVLIVEDNGLIGEIVAEMMVEAGARPIGPALTEREALDMISYSPEAPDGAILDLGLDKRSCEVAARLHELRIPFIFATGMPDQVPARFSHVPICAKPYTVNDLLTALHRAFEASPLTIVDDDISLLRTAEGKMPKLMIVGPALTSRPEAPILPGPELPAKLLGDA